MHKIKYNIRLNVKTLKSVFDYFKMNDKNSTIKLVTSNKRILEEASDYIYDVKGNSIYLKNIKFEKLYYLLSKNVIFNIYYYKGKEDNYEVCVHTRMDRIQYIEFNDKYDYEMAKTFLKQYKIINIEYIVLALLLIIGLIIRVLKG